MWVKLKVLLAKKYFYHCNITVDWSYDWCLHRKHSQVFDQTSYYWFISQNAEHTNSIIPKLTGGIRNLNANFKRVESNV